MLSVRVVTTDHYMAPPVRGVDVAYSEFRGTEVKRVPVLRIYGATEAGQKTCMHVHGVFPYLYVPYDGSEPVQRYLRQVASSIDKALNIGMGKANSTTQHVYKITLVSALPFYGYHDREQQFLKIYLYNPYMVKKTADLLLGGAVMNKVLQPYESHVPYNLQTFIDYNLYGMNMIKVAAAKFRQPNEGLPPEVYSHHSSNTSTAGSQGYVTILTPPEETHWDISTIPKDAWLPPTVGRQSSCELEVDVVAADILNRIEIGENIGTNPGLAALWDDERQRRREHEEDSHLSPPSSPDRGDVPWTDAEAELQERLRNIVIDLQPYINSDEDTSPALSQKESLTPSSQVESHHSLNEDLFSLSSQDTVILDPGKDEISSEAEAIVNETSILRVVSSSQSFHGSLPNAPKTMDVLDTTQDHQLAEMLASMADDDSTLPSSQAAASQALARVATLEDADSVLSQVSSSQTGPTPQEEAGQEEQEERDLLELSQSAWGEEGEPEAAQEEGSKESLSQMEFVLEGMDQSWNSSQWVDVQPVAKSDDDEETMPQYDGPADDKSENTPTTKKRLGMLGPRLPTFKVKTISPGAFSITAKTNEDTLITFTSSTKMHPVHANKSRTTPKNKARAATAPRTSPLDAPQSLRFDLRASEFKQLDDSDDSSEDQFSAKGHRLPEKKRKVREEEPTKPSRSSGKNSPKEASRASDAFVELSGGHTKQMPQSKTAQGRESRSGAAKLTTKSNTKGNAESPQKSAAGSARRRDGKHDNIFASLASELSQPNIVGLPTSSSSSSKASESAKQQSPRGKDLESSGSPKDVVVTDSRVELFMQKSRATLFRTASSKQSTATESASPHQRSGRSTPKTSSRSYKQKDTKRSPRLTSDEDIGSRGSESDFEPGGKRLLIPRRRSSDSSSESEVAVKQDSLKIPSSPSVPAAQRKANGEVRRPSHGEHDTESVNKASEVSDDQVSLRVDPDPESDVENMWDQTGCDDLPDIIDLPPDPTSISDGEQNQQDGPMTYEEHSTVIVTRPTKKSQRGRRSSAPARKSSSAHANKKEAQKYSTSTESSSYLTQGTSQSSSLKPSHQKTSIPEHSDAVGFNESSSKNKEEMSSKSCVSLAERKRKLSLKKLQKKQENALNKLNRQSSNNISEDTDSYGSNDLFSDSSTSVKAQPMDTSLASPTKQPSVTSPISLDPAWDLAITGDPTALQRSVNPNLSIRGRGRGTPSHRGGRSPGALGTLQGPVDKVWKRSQRGRRGKRGHRGQRHASPIIRSDEQDTVWFTTRNSVNYYNGVRVCLQDRKTRHMVDEANTRVRVLKSDCQKYNLTDIGEEALDLHNMNPYELIHNEDYKPACDKLYRKYAADKPLGRPAGVKKQQDSSSGSLSEMLITPGGEENVEIIDISALTAEASMFRRCQQHLSSMELSEEESGDTKDSPCPMDEDEPVKRQTMTEPPPSRTVSTHKYGEEGQEKLGQSSKPETNSLHSATPSSTLNDKSSTTTTLHSKPDPNSSKPGPRSSKTSHSSKPGPKSSKAPSQTSEQPVEPSKTDTQSSKQSNKSSEPQKGGTQSSKTPHQASKTAKQSSKQDSKPSISAQSSKSAAQSQKAPTNSSKSSTSSSKTTTSSSKVDIDSSSSKTPASSSKPSTSSSKTSSKGGSSSTKPSTSSSTKSETSSSKHSASSSKTSASSTKTTTSSSTSSSKTTSSSSKTTSSSTSSSKTSTSSSKTTTSSSTSSSKPSGSSSKTTTSSSTSSSKPSGSSSKTTTSSSTSSSRPSGSSSKTTSSSSKPSTSSSRTASHSTKTSSSKPSSQSSKHTSQSSKSGTQSSKSTSHSSKTHSSSSQPTTSRSNDTTQQQIISRQSLLENQQAEAKGDMVVDFSLLENPMDNAMEGLLSTEADPHHQLHTPPLVMDADKEETSPHAATSPETRTTDKGEKGKSKAASKRDSEQASDQAESSDDGQNTAENSQDETLTETDLYSDSNMDSNMGRDSPLVAPPESSSEIPAVRALKKQDSVSTEDSFTCETAGQRTKRKPSQMPRRASLKLKFKKVNSESSSEAQENQTESSDERSKQRKRRKVEQSDQYRYRSKRAAVDYSSDAYAHMYKEEKAKSQAPKDPIVKQRKRKVQSREPVQYIIINRFRGHKSMRVLLEKMDVGEHEVVHLNDLKRRKRQKRQHTSQTNTNSFGMLRQIVSDVPHENQSDPLWEAQIERLGGDDGDADDDEEEEGSGNGSSDDDSSQDSTNAEDSRSRKGQYHLGGGTTGAKGGPKKRVMSYHKRLSNAFCSTKTRRPKRKSEQTKIWNTLSLLHDATVAHLTSPSTTYSDDAEKDHSTEFVDVMYKLALFSPPQSEHGGDSPPQPLSPGCPTEDQEAAIQKQDEGPRKMQPPAYQNTLKASLLAQSSIDDSQSEIMPLTKSPVHALKSSARSSAANSPSGSDPEAHFNARQALASSEYNSSGMNANSTGSPYAVKEAIVHFNPSKASLFNQSKGYSKDSSPPDLGPPTLHQMSPHSLGSNTGSPPELVYQDKEQHHHQNQSSNSTSLDAYANFFGSVAGTSNAGKASYKTPSTLSKQPKDHANTKDRGRKGSVLSNIAAEKKESVSKGSSRSLSLKKSRSGSHSRPGDLTTPDSSLVRAVSDQSNSKQAGSSLEKDGSKRRKDEPTESSRNRGKQPGRSEADVNMPTSKSSTKSTEGKSYENQPTKKKVLSRFGINVHALQEQEKQNKYQKGEKDEDKKERKHYKSKPATSKSSEPVRGKEDSVKESRNRKAKEKVGKTQEKKHERQVSTSSSRSRSKKVEQSSESSEEEEDTCIRSQTPPQSPVECEPPQLENIHKTNTKQENDEESSTEEDDDTDEEEDKPKMMVSMTPIRSPSPVPFNVRCDMAVPLVPIATPRHPGSSSWERPPLKSYLHCPTLLDAPPPIPTDVDQALPASIYVSKLATNSTETTESGKSAPVKETREASKEDITTDKDKTQHNKPSEESDETQKSEEKEMDLRKEGEEKVEVATHKSPDNEASSQESEEETEDESDSEIRNCHRIDSPIRSPSPERRNSTSEEVSEQSKLPPQINETLTDKINEKPGLDVDTPTVSAEKSTVNESQNLSASELFSPEVQSDADLFSPVNTESEAKREKVEEKETESSTEGESEEESEDDEKSPKVVCSPIRSLSPPQSPTESKVEDDDSQQVPVRAIPTNTSNNTEVTAEKEKEEPVKLDTSFESTEDEEEVIEKCERLSSPIRSPSPPPTSPTHTPLVAETGLSSDAQISENQGKNQSASDLFSPYPTESSSPEGPHKTTTTTTAEVKDSAKDNSEKVDKPEAAKVKNKDEEIPKIADQESTKDKPELSTSEEEEESEEESEEDSEEENQGSADVEDFSPIRSPSPPPIASPVPIEEDPELTTTPPAEIPASVIGSPRPESSSNRPASPEHPNKKPEKETKPISPSPLQSARELEVEKIKETPKGAVLASKKHLFLAPVESPNPVVSEREEGELRSDDETGQETEDELNSSVKVSPAGVNNKGRGEDREEGEITETSTCRSSPVHSRLSDCSDEEEVIRTVTIMPPKLVLSEKEPSYEDDGSQGKTDTDTVDTLKTSTDTGDTVKLVTDTRDTEKSITNTEVTVKSVTDTLEPVTSVTDTVESAKSVAGTLEPVKSVTDILEPVKSVTDILEPVKSVTDISEPVKSVTDILEPVKSVTDISEPVKSVADTLEPVKSVADTEESVKTVPKEDAETDAKDSDSVTDTRDNVETDEVTRDTIKRVTDTQETREGGSSVQEEEETSKDCTSVETVKEAKKDSGDEEESDEEDSSEEESEDERPQVITCDSPIRSPSPPPDAEVLENITTEIAESPGIEIEQRKDRAQVESDQEKKDGEIESEQGKNATDVESEKGKSSKELENEQGRHDTETQGEKDVGDTVLPKEKPAASKHDSSDDDDDEDDDSDDDDDKESHREAALSIRSPSPIQSPDHDMGADLNEEDVSDTIRSPSPIQSPDQGSSSDRSGQPAVIPLTIDTTSVGDPRTRRPFLHPVPSPVGGSRCVGTGGSGGSSRPADHCPTADHTDPPGLPPHPQDSTHEDEGLLLSTTTQGVSDCKSGAPKAAAIREGTVRPPPKNEDPMGDQSSKDRAGDKAGSNRHSDSDSAASGGGGDGVGGSPAECAPSPGSGPAVAVLGPAVAPPSRQAVAETAGSARVGQQEAFFSDHSDAQQQRPREVGARVLKVQSNLVSALPEVESVLPHPGLYHWQSLLISEQLSSNPSLSQQSQGFDIQEEMKKNPQLKASLLGNQPSVITPTRLPPTKREVTMWMKAKDYLSKLNQEEMSKLKSKETDTKTGKSGEKREKIEDTNVYKTPKSKSGGEQKQQREAETNTPVTSNKGKAGKGGKVKNPNFTGIKRKRSTEEKPGPSEASRGDLSDLDRSDIPLVSPPAVEGGFKTPARRSRRSSSADGLMEDRTEAPPPTPDPLSIITQSPRAKRRRSVDDASPPQHSTPRVGGNVGLTRRVSFIETLTPSCTPIKRTHPPSPETPSSLLKPSLKRDATLTLATPTTRDGRGLRRSATPPPVGSTPSPSVRKRRSITPPPSLSSPYTSMSQDTPSGSQGRTRSKSRPLRRLSTNTQSFLRRLIQSSQSKNALLTQLSLASNVSQIEGATPKNTYGFKVSRQNVRDAKALHEFQYLTTLSIEVHATSRADLKPDPECDAIVGLFFSVLNDVPPTRGQREVTGAIVVDVPSAKRTQADVDDGEGSSGSGGGNQDLFLKSGVDLDVTYVRNEKELVAKFIELVKKWDPDLLVGWEIQTTSWGYLFKRAAHLSVNLCEQLSRIEGKTQDSHHNAEKDEWGADTMSEIHVAGRIVLNLWRILRHEVTLNIYTFENVMYHVLHRRVPKVSFRSLTTWWQHRTHLLRWRTIDYYVTRAKGNLQIMDQIDLIGQTSEFARVFGIEFFHVLSRGSQYRVESMMLRIAKPMNYAAISPGVQQRARQRAPECIPLTLEPESRFYTDPVVVLDFQSLYPSIMIAYNYCYSTCLGRLHHLERAHEGDFEFGCSSLNIPPALLKKLHKDVNVCPNGVVFVKQHIRKGIISRMVEDILRTRLMVKRSMKQYKDDKTLQRLLHARQLGLKLIANVTFGYTAANYSGRMACVEIGDSIVRKARETLERAIRLVESTERWNARVVYGDTDSLFICLPGRTKDQAFKIGQDIADAVTADNPKPVKLKFEKVYLPCVLQTKKRYVGFMYETPDQKDPVFDAKGIETVRRDGCGAVSKILERSIKILFTSRDLSMVKQYVQRQILKILEGHADMQDFIFAKEYRGMAGYKPAATVPALEIAKRRLAKDRCSEPRVGERVPYVIVYGTPGLPLIQLVREPQALLADPSLRLNATYYITKAILPPLDRAFGLMGVDVHAWYTDLPRIHRIVPPSYYTADQKKGTISQYFTTLNCPVCEETMVHGACPLCHDDPQRVAVILNDRVHRWEHTHSRLSQVCYSCMRTKDSCLPCTSLDCPVLFRVLRSTRDMSQVPHLRQIQKKLLKD